MFLIYFHMSQRKWEGESVLHGEEHVQNTQTYLKNVETIALATEL